MLVSSPQWSALCQCASYHVVDLEDAADGLGGEGQGADGDQQRLDHQLLQDIGDPTLTGEGTAAHQHRNTGSSAARRLSQLIHVSGK